MDAKRKSYLVKPIAALFVISLVVLIGMFYRPSSNAHAGLLPRAECGESQAICGSLVSDMRELRDPKYGFVRAGLPRYTEPFGRDSLIVAWQLLGYDSSIAKDTLLFWAKRQGKKFGLRGEQPGKIPHWTNPESKKSSVYYSADATPLYVFVAGEYLKKTGDKALLGVLWTNITDALSWCEHSGHVNQDLFIEYRPIRDKNDGMVHQGWKDGNSDHLHITPPVALVEIQGYYYAALMSGAEIARALGHEAEAKEYSVRARDLQREFLEKFWIPDAHAFAFAIDGKGMKDERIVSNMGQLLFTGILDDEPDKRDAVVARMFSPDMWTKYGIRTGATTNWDFDPYLYHQGTVWPHDNWIIAQGLKRYGYDDKYEAVKAAQVRAFRSLRGIPELYTVERSGKHKPWTRA